MCERRSPGADRLYREEPCPASVSREGLATSTCALCQFSVRLGRRAPLCAHPSATESFDGFQFRGYAATCSKSDGFVMGKRARNLCCHESAARNVYGRDVHTSRLRSIDGRC